MAVVVRAGTVHTHILIEIAEQRLRLVEERDGALAADVRGRQRLHVPRQEQLPVLGLVPLLGRQPLARAARQLARFLLHRYCKQLYNRFS